jgi:small subunit ribosomal protein S17
VANETQTPASPAQDGRAKSRKRVLIGVVVSDKMDKTRVVLVERRLAHAKYGKYMTRRTKYKAHDEKNEFRAGDRVEIVESRPLSRAKRWRVQRLLERPQQA